MAAVPQSSGVEKPDAVRDDLHFLDALERWVETAKGVAGDIEDEWGVPWHRRCLPRLREKELDQFFSDTAYLSSRAPGLGLNPAALHDLHKAALAWSTDPEAQGVPYPSALEVIVRQVMLTIYALRKDALDRVLAWQRQAYAPATEPTPKPGGRPPVEITPDEEALYNGWVKYKERAGRGARMKEFFKGIRRKNNISISLARLEEVAKVLRQRARRGA
ncbi:MAG: hypothetical protein ACYC35_30120 [Pirellulales bacterium]